MVTLKHHCQFCAVPVTVQIESEAQNIFSIEKWKSFAACNRCSDFLEGRRRSYKFLTNAAIVYRQDVAVILSRLANTPDPKDKDKLRDKLERLRAQLEKRMKTWLTTLNIYFKTNVPWDSTVMDHLSNNSVVIMTILSGCERMIREHTSIPSLRIGHAKLPEP